MMGVVLYIIIGSFSLLFLYFYIWARHYYAYWRRKGVKHPKPLYFLGNIIPIKVTPSELYTQLYSKYSKDKFVGFYELSKIRLLIIDPDIIQRVLIKEFSHFTDRDTTLGSGNNKNNDGSIFAMTGHKWRAIRNKLSPTFTSGKLKVMFDRMIECFNNLDHEIESKKGQEMEARDMMFSYTMDIIASCAFGLDINKDKKSAAEFRAAGLKALKMDLPKLMSVVILSNFPLISKVFNISLMNKETMVYFGKVLTGALKHRRETGQSRNDFLQLLIQLKDKGSVEYHAIEPEDHYLNIEKSSKEDKYEFTERMVMAQAFTFITAGMEPSGNTLTFVLAELAYRQDIQDNVRKEIQEVLEKNDFHFTYQAIKDMEFLENCILETLRLYPVGQQIRRVCTKKFHLDGGVSLDVGTNIVVPAKAIHLDPRYFNNPLEFNPDRFKDPVKAGTFFPFGDGPRICIGMRFAMVEMKVCLAKLISNYRLSPGENFIYPIPLNRWSFFSVPSKPVYIKLNKITS